MLKSFYRCQERKISLNRDKWIFCQTRVVFAGFRLSSQGYHIDSSITEAISKFPTSANCTDLRSFFGLANYLSFSTDAVAELLASLCSLLSMKNEYLWSSEHDQAFTKAKEHLVDILTLA